MFSSEIGKFISDKVGGILVVSVESGQIVYADKFFKERYEIPLTGVTAEDALMWFDNCPQLSEENSVEWESIDTDIRRFYKIESGLFSKDEKQYQIHMVTDITEYMSLNRDITKYMSFFKKLSGFQTAVLERLSSTYYELLPMLTDYFSTKKAYFMLQRNENADVITYNKTDKTYSSDRVKMSEVMEKTFDCRINENICFEAFSDELQEVMVLTGSDSSSEFRMICSGSVSGQRYALYLGVEPKMDEESLKEPALLSVIKLYLENGIMREKLIYDSEHDSLTGLYNKGKYLSMVESKYQKLDSIGIFNLDVNNLKVMNDTYGHEAGDKLLIKAANSIRKVTTNKVHGYRMGGDEYLMVACNVTEDEVNNLKERWEKELARLNTYDDGINCVIAVGVVYGEKEYDFQALMKKADELMYEDKKRKKKPGEEIR